MGHGMASTAGSPRFIPRRRRVGKKLGTGWGAADWAYWAAAAVHLWPHQEKREGETSWASGGIRPKQLQEKGNSFSILGHL
jgi:hypothetical protein